MHESTRTNTNGRTRSRDVRLDRIEQRHDALVSQVASLRGEVAELRSLLEAHDTDE